MPQPARDPVTVHRRPHRLADDQPYPRAAIAMGAPAEVDDDVGLHQTRPAFDGRVELSRPPHTVACGKHRQNLTLRSGRQRAAALTAPVGHDRTPRTGPHAQAEAMHAGSAPVVRLEGPLALGHGVLLVVSRSKLSQPSGRSRFATAGVRVSVEAGLATGRRGPQAGSPRSQPYRRLSGDCLRVLMRLRWVKLGLPQRTHTQAARKHSFSAARSRPKPHRIEARPKEL